MCAMLFPQSTKLIQISKFVPLKTVRPCMIVQLAAGFAEWILPTTRLGTIYKFYMQNSKTIVTPRKYYGKQIAWNEDQSEVIASGDDAAQVEQKAIATGRPYSLDKVPAANEFFAGSATLQ